MSAVSRALDYMRGQIEVQDGENAALRESLGALRSAAADIADLLGRQHTHDERPTHCDQCSFRWPCDNEYMRRLLAQFVPSPSADPPVAAVEADDASGAAPPAAPLAPPAAPLAPTHGYPGSQAGWQWHNDAGSLDAEEIMATAHARDLSYLKAHPDFLSLVTDRFQWKDET